MTTEPTLPTTCVDHLLTGDERDRFERDGFLPIPGALDAPTVSRFVEMAEAEAQAFHAGPGVHPYALLNQHDLIGRDPAYLDLIDWPTTFPKVFGALGWNIQLFHTQLVVTPPGHPDAARGGYAWHQDNNRMNLDFETAMPHPRVSVKIAYFLTDLAADGMGNFCVIPASHRDAEPDAKRGVEVTARAGDAMLFDRRLWHSASSNHSVVTRVVLFFGYSYRWLRPKSAMDFPELVEQCDAIRRQLLGAATSANGYFDPTPDDVPLREWMRLHLGAPPSPTSAGVGLVSASVPESRMEKLQYLCWPRDGLSPSDHGRIVRDDIVPALLALDPRGLSVQVDDADAQVPVPMPPPADEVQPFALVSLWLDRYDDRAPFEAVLREHSDRIAGYLVTESMYTEYGGNEHGRPRDWPDGTRSPGVVMTTLLRRPEHMSVDEWITHWHTVQSPVSESMQPRMRYVRNAVARAITPNAPPIEGIVEEAWPSPEHITDPMLFYCAGDDAALMKRNLSAMLESVMGFLELDTLRSFTTSEYLYRT